MRNKSETDIDFQRSKFTLLLLGFLLLSISCNSTGESAGGNPKGPNNNNSPTRLTLQCLEQHVAVSPGETTGVPIQLSLVGVPPPKLELRLEGISGANWQSALCYASHCFINEGLSELVETIAWVDPASLEIKFLVPGSASPGDSLLLRLTITPSNRRSGGDSIELTGYVP
jgi:hypothetical protein